MNRIISTSLVAFAFALGANADGGNIVPGGNWNDTKGSAINAHGGCVQYTDGFYYWFGEDRTGMNSNGVSCYRSSDLYNWTRVGLALTPTGTMTDENRDIAKGRLFERPKVIYNASTGKWVMWVHWENGSDYGEAKVCVAQADKVEGPYTMVDVFRPNNHDSRDQTLFLDTDGSAYHICSTNMNSNTNIALLSDDYLTPTSSETLQLLGKKYEAASIFKVGDIYYGLFSGCTGWTPNRGRYTYTYDMLGEWVSGNDFKDQDGSTGINFCTDSGKDNTYQSQSAYVFPVQGKDKCFVYMGDRWNSSNVQSSKYIWLPVSVRSGYPAVRWYDSWNMSVFDEMYRYKRAAEVEDGGEYCLLERNSDRIVSRPKTSLTLENDGESNIFFIFHKTDIPYVYKIEEKATGKYIESLFGSLRFQTEADKDSQKWVLVLEEDGYYHIQNYSDGACLSVSGNETLAGTTVYLNDKDKNIHQSFGVYFDSKAHPEYVEADMYGKSYREKNRELMAEQNEVMGIKGIGSSHDLYSKLEINDGLVTISGMSATTVVDVYTVSGVRLAGSRGSHASFNLNAGVYLLRIDGKVIKIRIS
ncbi:MAG: RICIN domain-containing protein [Bacteroides sp.]|nr:RICIN domain-containing protein [Roseburia sp.]MCM1346407.1 RICIN domain-containing protein [Bacteroides sp.]MCM1420950.1 RICIN domain-containing protein [Bacteroides sp.]